MRKLFALFLALTLTAQLTVPAWAETVPEETEEVTEVSEIPEEPEEKGTEETVEEIPEETTEATEEEVPEETEATEATEASEGSEDMIAAEATEPTEETAVSEKMDNTVEEFAVDETDYKDFEWYRDRSGICISGYTGSSRNVIIPEKIYDFPVVAIGPRAFSGNNLISVTIPDGVTDI